MRLSIIIPVYNVEPYVERCLRSLEEQDLPKDQYEIIVTNDGSPDNSRDVVLRLQREFPNITLIEQENKGVSVARNVAIERARGDYILPIDPDDYVLPHTLKSALEKAEQLDLDVLYLSFDILSEDEHPVWRTPYQELAGKIFTGTEANIAARGPHIRDPDRSFAILYRRSMLTEYNIDYPEQVPYLEDGLFLSKALCIARRCAFDATPFYQRTTRPGSATNSDLFFSERALKGFLLAIDDIVAFRRRNKLNEQQEGLVNQTIVKFVLLPLQACVTAFQPRRYREIKAYLFANNYRQLELRGCRSIYLRLGRIYNLSPTLFFAYYYLLVKSKAIHIRFKKIIHIW